MSEWKKARKKPIVIEFREVEPKESVMNTVDFAKGLDTSGMGEYVYTHEGKLVAITGKDFIIKGVQGELYPIKKDIFYENYEVLEE